MDSLLQLSQKKKNRMNKMNLFSGKVRRWVNKNKLSLTIVLHQFMMEKNNSKSTIQNSDTYFFRTSILFEY